MVIRSMVMMSSRSICATFSHIIIMKLSSFSATLWFFCAMWVPICFEKLTKLPILLLESLTSDLLHFAQCKYSCECLALGVQRWNENGCPLPLCHQVYEQTQDENDESPNWVWNGQKWVTLHFSDFVQHLLPAGIVVMRNAQFLTSNSDHCYLFQDGIVDMMNSIPFNSNKKDFYMTREIWIIIWSTIE